MAGFIVPTISPTHFRICCTNTPDELLDRVNSANHFKQFGRVYRISLRQKQKICCVDYGTKENALKAIECGNVYRNQLFNIKLVETQPAPKRPVVPQEKVFTRRKEEKDPDWPNDAELQSELDALGEIVPHQHLFRSLITDDSPAAIEPAPVVKKTLAVKRPVKKLSITPPSKLEKKVIKKSPLSPRVRKTVRSRFPEDPTKFVKKRVLSKAVSKPKIVPEKKIDVEQVASLVSIVSEVGKTAEDKYRILDARDKLIRVFLGTKQLNIDDSKIIIGTCPDMCPEKERLQRETQHQVSIYEQDETVGEYNMDHNKAIKQYSRSSAAQEMPLPHELRPVQILQLTMNYMFHNIINLCETPDVNIGEWYFFVWDRTRSIRKDITQQQMCCLGSVELVEQCARFHIHCAARLCGEDAFIFDPKINTENLTKCLQTLKYMYHDLALQNIYSKNESEFRGYIILLNLHDINFMWQVKELRPEIRNSQSVSFALKVFFAMDSNNYVSFFKLVRSTTYLNACLLLRYFNIMRFRALDRMILVYSPSTYKVAQIPLVEIQNLLAFEDQASTIAFLQDHGLSFNNNFTDVILERRKFIQPQSVEIDRAIGVIESKRNGSVGEIICGKALPILQQYAPETIFTSNGKLKQSAIDPEWFSLTNKPRIDPPKIDIFAKKEENFPKKDEIFPKKEVKDTIFGIPKTIPSLFTKKIDAPIFSQKTTNIFDSPTIPKQSESIFGKKDSIFAVKEPESIFAKPEPKSDSIFNKPVNIFDFNKPKETSIFKNDNIFQKPPEKNIFGASNFTLKPAETPKPFTFAPIASKDVVDATPNPVFQKPVDFFNDPRTKHMFENQQETQRLKAIEEKRIADEQRALEEKEEKRIRELKKLELELMKKQEEIRAKLAQEELERQRLLEEQILRDQLLEQMRLKQEAEQRRLREVEQRRKQELAADLERKKTVAVLLNDMVIKVVEIDTKRRLDCVKEKVKLWKALEFGRKWYRKVNSMKLKRKAVEDLPIWLPKRSFIEEAHELYTDNQSLALANMRRYKIKHKFKEIPTEIERKINFKQFYNLIQKSIQIRENLIKSTIYWKLIFSIPDPHDCNYHTQKLLQIFDECLELPKTGNTYIDTYRIHNDTFQVCVEILTGYQNINTSYQSENVNFIFFGINSPEYFPEMKKRLHKVIKNCENLIIIIRNPTQSRDASVLRNELGLSILLDSKIIKKYFILEDLRYLDPVLENKIEEGLKVLARNFKTGVPPLEMNLVTNFLYDNIGHEFGQRLHCTMQENYGVNLACRDINVVISIYNEGLKKLSEIVTNIKNYPQFPKNFKPNDCYISYPRSYEYFPPYWNQKAFIKHSQKLVESLLLPKFSNEWPPKDIRELEDSLENYASQYVDEKSLDLVFLKILSYSLEYFEQSAEEEDFETQMLDFPIIDILQILINYKIKYVQENHNQFDPILIYNKQQLREYQTKPWWLVESKVLRQKLLQLESKSKNLDVSEEEIEILFYDDFDIDGKLEELYQMDYDEVSKKELVKTKSELSKFKNVIEDLESAMEIQKQAMNKFDEILERELKS